VAIVKYDDVKEKPSTLRALTSLEREEFEELRVVFGEAWERHRQAVGYDASQGGRPPQLAAIEDKLLFILFYLKTYPLQEVQGHWFGLSQGQANLWIHRLSDVLKEALKDQGHLPAQLPAEMLARLEDEGRQTFGIDGTERRIQRPAEDARQRQHYSGKKKPIRSRTTS
jgi:Helix-turn-helix of DDE superfamily endonuclease